MFTSVKAKDLRPGDKIVEGDRQYTVNQTDNVDGFIEIIGTDRGGLTKTFMVRWDRIYTIWKNDD